MFFYYKNRMLKILIKLRQNSRAKKHCLQANIHADSRASRVISAKNWPISCMKVTVQQQH